MFKTMYEINKLEPILKTGQKLPQNLEIIDPYGQTKEWLQKQYDFLKSEGKFSSPKKANTIISR